MRIKPEAAGSSDDGAIAAFMRIHRLSPQEGRLIEAALRELSTEDIARELGCSPSTVRTYWSRILQKVGCSKHQHVFARITRFTLSRSEVRQMAESLHLAPLTPRDEAAENAEVVGSFTKTIGLVALLVSWMLLAGGSTVAMNRAPERERSHPSHGPALPAQEPPLSEDFRSFRGAPIRAGQAVSCQPGAADAHCYGAPHPPAPRARP